MISVLVNVKLHERVDHADHPRGEKILHGSEVPCQSTGNSLQPSSHKNFLYPALTLTPPSCILPLTQVAQQQDECTAFNADSPEKPDPASNSMEITLADKVATPTAIVATSNQHIQQSN